MVLVKVVIRALKRDIELLLINGKGSKGGISNLRGSDLVVCVVKLTFMLVSRVKRATDDRVLTAICGRYINYARPRIFTKMAGINRVTIDYLLLTLTQGDPTATFLESYEQGVVLPLVKIKSVSEVVSYNRSALTPTDARAVLTGYVG